MKRGKAQSHQQPTYGELQVYLLHVEAGSVSRRADAPRDREAVIKVHTWLWQLAKGEAGRKAA